MNFWALLPIVDRALAIKHSCYSVAEKNARTALGLSFRPNRISSSQTAPRLLYFICGSEVSDLRQSLRL